MKILTVPALVLAAILPAAAADHTISAYEVTLAIAEDGSAKATAVVTVDGATPGVLAIPLGFPGIGAVEVTDGPAGTVAAARAVNGQSELVLTLPDGAPASCRVAITFPVGRAFQKTEPGPGERRTLPEGVLLFRHAIVNAEPSAIGRYRFSVSFPASLRAHAVREALPRLRKTEAGPRARLGAVDGRGGAWLEVTKLSQGDSASLQIELVPGGRSPAWVIAGLVLCVLYLVYFRDLVKPSAA